MGTNAANERFCVWAYILLLREEGREEDSSRIDPDPDDFATEAAAVWRPPKVAVPVTAAAPIIMKAPVIDVDESLLLLLLWY